MDQLYTTALSPLLMFLNALEAFQVGRFSSKSCIYKTKNEKGVCQYGCLEQQMNNESFKQEYMIKEPLENQTEQKKPTDAILKHSIYNPMVFSAGAIN